MRNASHFARDSALYACRCCGRNTRQTGRGDNEHIQLCALCYELGGWENQVQDGYTLTTADAAEVRGMIAQVVALGGRDRFTEFFFPAPKPTTQGAATVIHSTVERADPATLSQTPAAVRARARRAALRAKSEPTTPQLGALQGGVHLSGGTVESNESTSEGAPAAGVGAFAALTAGLTTSSRDVSAALAASAAINKARKVPTKSAPKTPTKAPVGAPTVLDPTEYRVGEYKGRAGTAMYAFVERVRTLGGCVNRERMLFSCAAAQIHPLVKDRAAVLDYFAWAARHAVLVEAKPAPAQRRRKSRPLNPLAGE